MQTSATSAMRVGKKRKTKPRKKMRKSHSIYQVPLNAVFLVFNISFFASIRIIKWKLTYWDRVNGNIFHNFAGKQDPAVSYLGSKNRFPLNAGVTWG